MERVVLLDAQGNPTGSADKATIHTADTPLHLAFSCYLLNDSGQLLLTRRALSKKTWPGVWTNSFCGHPAPGEEVFDAIRRRAHEELGTTVEDIQVVLPKFQYRATDASGIVENEICPVHLARISSDLGPNPEEIAEWAWADPAAVIDSVTNTPFAFSPWLVEQFPDVAPALLELSQQVRVQ